MDTSGAGCYCLPTFRLRCADGLAQFFHQRPKRNSAFRVELVQPFVDIGEHFVGVVQRVLGEDQVAIAKLVERVVDESEGHFHVSLDQLHANAFPRPMLLVHGTPRRPYCAKHFIAFCTPSPIAGMSKMREMVMPVASARAAGLLSCGIRLRAIGVGDAKDAVHDSGALQG